MKSMHIYEQVCSISQVDKDNIDKEDQLYWLVDAVIALVNHNGRLFILNEWSIKVLNWRCATILYPLNTFFVMRTPPSSPADIAAPLPDEKNPGSASELKLLCMNTRRMCRNGEGVLLKPWE